jgi:hypothetical protein
LQKAGFRIVRQGKHVVMSNGQRIVTIPRHNPSMPSRWGIARDAGLSPEQFEPAKRRTERASSLIRWRSPHPRYPSSYVTVV